jgi:hypothetical protein
MHQFFYLAPRQNIVILASVDELTQQPNNYQVVFGIFVGLGEGVSRK